MRSRVRREMDSTSSAAKHDSRAKLEIGAYQYTSSQIHRSSGATRWARSADNLFFLTRTTSQELTFTKVVFPVPPSPTVLNDIRSQQKRCGYRRWLRLDEMGVDQEGKRESDNGQTTRERVLLTKNELESRNSRISHGVYVVKTMTVGSKSKPEKIRQIAESDKVGTSSKYGNWLTALLLSGGLLLQPARQLSAVGMREFDLDMERHMPIRRAVRNQVHHEVSNFLTRVMHIGASAVIYNTPFPTLLLS